MAKYTYIWDGHTWFRDTDGEKKKAVHGEIVETDAKESYMLSNNFRIAEDMPKVEVKAKKKQGE